MSFRRSHTVLLRMIMVEFEILIGGSIIHPHIYTFYCSEFWYFGLQYTIAIDFVCLVTFIARLIQCSKSLNTEELEQFICVGWFSIRTTRDPCCILRDPLKIPNANIFLWALLEAMYVSGALIYAFNSQRDTFREDSSMLDHLIISNIDLY